MWQLFVIPYIFFSKLYGIVSYCGDGAVCCALSTVCGKLQSRIENL